MPVNLRDIQRKLDDFSAQAQAHQAQVASCQQEITGLIATYANKLDEVRARVAKAAALVPQLRCAVPVDEPLDAFFPKPALPEKFTLLATDGSQINPSRHARVAFCVINVGVVKLMRGSDDAPTIGTHSQLLDFDAVFLPGGGIIPESSVALMRDLSEREALIAYAEDLQFPAISMTDGPLELYREPRETQEFQKKLDHYLEILQELRNRQLMTLGYVDKPGSDLISRLLELLVLSDQDLAAYHQLRRRFAGVLDTGLLGRTLANPGDRSAVFRIHSQMASNFRQDLALHFFYLNVGQPGKPHLARVEIPAWVAEDKHLVGLLQAVLMQQAEIMGTRPYPYILHRAHEVAVVTLPEHQHVEKMIMAEFDRRGIETTEQSNKQYHKDLPTGKTRYQG